MNTKSKNRKLWGKTLLATIGISFILLIVPPIIMLMFTPVNNGQVNDASGEFFWIYIIWVGVLSISVGFIMFLGFLFGSEFPDTRNLFVGTKWATIGGLTFFVGFIILIQSSCCYKNDYYMMGCFGPLVALIGFALASTAQEYFPLLAIGFAAPFVAGLLQPFIGETLAKSLFLVLSFGAGGLIFYLRATRGLPRGADIPSRTIVWNRARCPRCDNLWTLGRVVIEIPERCPTCDWSWVDEKKDPYKISSFLQNSSPKKR